MPDTHETAERPEITAAVAADVWSRPAPGEAQFLALLRADPARELENMARRAQQLTRQHFGRAITLYAPLYLANFCSGGCAYCGFAADRQHPRRRLEPAEVVVELTAMKAMGFEQVLLLTGERTPQADFDYLLANVRAASRVMHEVTVEAFPMTVAEYRQLAEAGCTGVTLYQETYDPEAYARWHRWGPKRDYAARLEAPARALEAGMRTIGLGALLGLADPVRDAVALYRHVCALQTHYWRAGVSVSFPRLRPEAGGFAPPSPVSDTQLAQIILAFRICLPDTPLVLSTRESPTLRDGLAGLGITRMSVASRTTVGGYSQAAVHATGQFAVSDDRDIATFCAMLRQHGLDPVFKNWDAAYRVEVENG
jgi:2-iminoacetate synthase